MKYYSTKNRNETSTFRNAIVRGLAPDGGLYMPESFPLFPASFFTSDKPDLQYIAECVLTHFVGDEIERQDLQNIIESAFNFAAPVIPLDDELSILELFHGPTLAFKDFGARFMARALGYFAQKQEKEVIILVATSGDTGSAVAQGFYKTPGVRVVILFPSGKVSTIQQKQLTTLGENITALEIDGVFDDCQKLVKTAFSDSNLNKKKQLSSANSINIARLLPQSLYYISSYISLKRSGKPVRYCVPSGNFGNLTGGLFAQKMGLPVDAFIAATNINDVVPQYLQSGIFKTQPSVHTLSNAMDVGNPSNFERMMSLFNNDYESIKRQIVGKAYNDDETKAAIKEVFDKYNYIIDPHGAVAYLAAKDYATESDSKIPTLILETAHPSKFKDTVSSEIQTDFETPERLSKWIDRKETYISMRNDYKVFREFLDSF